MTCWRLPPRSTVTTSEMPRLCSDLPARLLKSSEMPLSASTVRNGQNLVAGGEPGIPVRNAADRCWSRHETMMWFSCTLTPMILPGFPTVRTSRRPGRGHHRARHTRTLPASAVDRALIATWVTRAVLRSVTGIGWGWCAQIRRYACRSGKAPLCS